MKAWNRLDATKLDLPKKTQSNGIMFEVSLSPYDIPEGFRGRYCEERDRFLIEFKYLANEQKKEREVNDLFSVLEGVNSGRLYAIIVDAKKHGLDKISLELLVNAVDSIKDSLSSQSDRSLPWEKNARLLDAYQPDLIDGLKTAFPQFRDRSAQPRMGNLNHA